MTEAAITSEHLPKDAVKATLAILDPSHSSEKTIELKNTEKRDSLIKTEKRYQQLWQTQAVFEPDAPDLQELPFETTDPEQLHSAHPKYHATFAFPYMNGSLHAGHSFTASKVEFTIGYERMQGKRALFPLGYHVTGMPIKACADKLIREIEQFGPTFEKCPVDDIIETPPTDGAFPTAPETKTDMSKFTAKKGKAAAKTIKTKYQFQIMLAQGIALEEIHKFADPQYWIKYFPPLAKRDLINFGARIDWRRQFVTTDANPYFDSFVQWQMRKLKELGKIVFGRRYTVYSPKDGQACLDHDRQSGEGVLSQEYTALKMKVKEWSESAKKLLEGRIPDGTNVYFIPATLRPETMYGQTCLFVGPQIDYAIFKASDLEYIVCSRRAARNMAFQSSVFPKWGEFPEVASFKGSSVIGTLVHAPLSVHKDGVRILPMETVKDTKGTAVVTCVPSDSPDDYATVLDLAKKASYYGIEKEWAELEILPIIDTPDYGNLTAKTLVEQLKIQSPKDTKKLEEAKEKAYKSGFYKGTMIYGDYKGRRVEDAKSLVRQQLIDSGHAFAYAEPDGKVISRSGDDCVVAHLDQWSMNYGTTENGGDGEWAQRVLSYIEDGLNLYYPEAKHAFVGVINWLANWACARSYGLGTKLPWDHSVMVESLSDSTIYQSYYTFAHLLHRDMFGKEAGPLAIKPEQLTDDVWDYVLARRDRSDIPQTDIPAKSIQTLRRHFDYWYPLDMRVSGKDLIQNHLTFHLYVHTALFDKSNWPRSIRVNGHLMLNGEKMSKSTGNFLTLSEAVNKFGADATRIALADAGDGIEDANFEETVANSNILKLFELRNWCHQTQRDAVLVEDAEKYKHVRDNERIKNADTIQRKSGSPWTLFDQLFDNEMNVLVAETKKHYEVTNYKSALRSGYYDFTAARDFYREATKSAGTGMHEDLSKRYIELQALMITPIAPHWADYIWQEVLDKKETIQNALWPEVPVADPSLTAAREYVRTTSSNITSSEGQTVKRLAKGKATQFDPKKAKKITIFVAQDWPQWQKKYIDLLHSQYPNIDIKSLSKSIDKSESKKAMPFINNLKRRLDNGESADTVLKRQLAFEELSTLRAMVPGLKQTVQKCVAVDIISVEEGGKAGIAINEDGSEGEKTELPPNAGSAEPGSPSFAFENVQ